MLFVSSCGSLVVTYSVILIRCDVNTFSDATGTLKRTGNTVCTVKNELANERLTCLYNDELEKKNYDSVQTLNRARMVRH